MRSAGGFWCVSVLRQGNGFRVSQSLGSAKTVRSWMQRLQFTPFYLVKEYLLTTNYK